VWNGMASAFEGGVFVMKLLLEDLGSCQNVQLSYVYSLRLCMYVCVWNLEA